MKSSEAKKNSKAVIFLAFVIGLMTFALFTFGILAIEAIAAMVAWSWFVHPVLGADKISFQESMGLVALVNLIVLPIAVPLNSISASFASYSKGRAVADMINVVKNLSDFESKIKENK